MLHVSGFQAALAIYDVKHRWCGKHLFWSDYNNYNNKWLPFQHHVCCVYFESNVNLLRIQTQKVCIFLYIITFTVYSLEFWVESNRSGETSRPTKPLTLTLDSGTQFSPQECMCVMFSFFVFSSLFWGGRGLIL